MDGAGPGGVETLAGSVSSDWVALVVSATAAGTINLSVEASSGDYTASESPRDFRDICADGEWLELGEGDGDGGTTVAVDIAGLEFSSFGDLAPRFYASTNGFFDPWEPPGRPYSHGHSQSQRPELGDRALLGGAYRCAALWPFRRR